MNKVIGKPSTAKLNNKAIKLKRDVQIKQEPMSTEFDLVHIDDDAPNEVKIFAIGIIKEGNMVSSRIGNDTRRMKERLFNRPDWAQNDDPIATLQQHIDAMGVLGTVLFSGAGLQSRIAALLKRIPKDDPVTAIQMLEGAKQALDSLLETIDPDYEQDPDIVPPVPYTIDESGTYPKVVFDSTAEYPGPTKS